MVFGKNKQQHKNKDNNPVSQQTTLNSSTSASQPRSGGKSSERPKGFIDVTSSNASSLSPGMTPTGITSITSTPTNTSTPTMAKGAKPKRRSWFSLGRTKQLISNENSGQLLDGENQITSSTAPPPSAWNGYGQERLRPIQFQPNRIQTLYVTKSEKDLYLAAMSQLDENPPPLPLWSDRAPELPNINTTQFTPLKAPSIPNSSIYRSKRGHQKSQSENTSLLLRPLSPKLVTSPQIGKSGLMIRDEFRSNSPAKQSKHALMAFTLPSGIRFTGFPPSAITAIDLVLQENWDQGITSRSETSDQLNQKREDAKFTWKVELQGKAWKRKGSQELDTIRLLIALLSILGIHGWTTIENVQAGGQKKDAHNLLFSYSPETSMNPPLFFALSIPLPDRLSLISPPPKVTPAIISALREAIITNPAKISKHSRYGTAATTATGVTVDSGADNQYAGSRKTKWQGQDPRGIKLEGWVHDGVYRFWIDGMRRWLGGRLKRRIVENLHPNLLISIINNTTNLHFQLAASIPLLPIIKGRDVLIFSSLPSSGLSVVDSYIPKDPSSIRSESPVLVAPAASLPPQEVLEDPREVDPGNRQLPWTSVVANNKSVPASPSKPSNPPPVAAILGKRDSQRKRTASRESSKPLLAAPSASYDPTSTPKQKNVLVKKNSLQRRRSTSADGSHSRQHSESGGRISAQGVRARQSIDGTISSQNYNNSNSNNNKPIYGQSENHRHLHIANPDNSSEKWSFIDPAPAAATGISAMFDPAAVFTHHHHVPLSPEKRHDQQYNLPRASNEDGTRTSHDESVYADAQYNPGSNDDHGEYNHSKVSQQNQTFQSTPNHNGVAGNRDLHHESDYNHNQGIPKAGMPIFFAKSPESELYQESELGYDNSIQQPLSLGQPMNSDHDNHYHTQEPMMVIPLKGNENGNSSFVDSPERRGRRNLVDIDLGSTVQSQHGSVGYLQSMKSGISGNYGNSQRISGDLDHLPRLNQQRQQRLPQRTQTPSQTQAQDAGYATDREISYQDKKTVPQPEIQIIAASNPTTSTSTSSASASGSPERLMINKRSSSNKIRNNEDEYKEYQINKYQDWERKGKVKEGMRRIWDENENTWKDIPIGNNINNNNNYTPNGQGIGSGRTRISLGQE
ncbi:uncharacterized protein L201_006537 [Kwoniella dendrophila CBS 6074]|uniref:Meiotically up-regulated protein Msb1/Mug8 domain-containing protein n=1 Tax=Kwoniella dendrophila CBS 6074 TaxID=1295534 RepID=A0AAX4K1I5_9TREE